LLLLPIEPDANKSLGGVLLEQPSATHAKPPKISIPTSSYDLSWTAVLGEMHRVKSQSSTSCLQSGTANLLTLCAYTIDAEVSKILRPLAGEGPVSPGDWQKVRVLESNENDNARR
jgi:hypothetical protein